MHGCGEAAHRLDINLMNSSSVFFQLNGRNKRKKSCHHLSRGFRSCSPGLCQRRFLHFGCFGSRLSVFSKAAVVCQEAADCSFQAAAGCEGAQVSLVRVKEAGRLQAARLSQVARF